MVIPPRFESWNDSAANAVSNIFSLVRIRPTIGLEHLRQNLDDFITSLFDKQSGRQNAQTRFAGIGADAIELARKLDINLTEKYVTTTLIRKQRDYGPENIARFGRRGLLVRLHDKVARLENLTARGASPENEAIADTYLDIVGYAAIGLMWEAGEFLLPLE